MIKQDGKTYFTKNELACNHCGMVRLAPNFANHLLTLRLAFNAFMSPSSVCRCEEHNTNVRGHFRSLHLADKPYHPTEGACAMDVRWRSWPTKKKLLFAQLSWSLGWSVGLHDGFCHIDRRADFNHLTGANLQKACFLYDTWSGRFSPGDVVS